MDPSSCFPLLMESAVDIFAKTKFSKEFFNFDRYDLLVNGPHAIQFRE